MVASGCVFYPQVRFLVRPAVKTVKH